MSCSRVRLISDSFLYGSYAILSMTFCYFTSIKVMSQITVFRQDDSCADVFLIPDSLHDELRRIMMVFELDEVNLAFLRQTKERVLSNARKTLEEHDFEVNESQKILDVALSSLDWFGYLLDLICLIEQLNNPESLILTVSE